jgi:hypothetical protein
MGLASIVGLSRMFGVQKSGAQQWLVSCISRIEEFSRIKEATLNITAVIDFTAIRPSPTLSRLAVKTGGMGPITPWRFESTAKPAVRPCDEDSVSLDHPDIFDSWIFGGGFAACPSGGSRMTHLRNADATQEGGQDGQGHKKSRGLWLGTPRQCLD